MRKLLLILCFIFISIYAKAQFGGCAFDTTKFEKKDKTAYSFGFFIPLDLDQSIKGSMLNKDDFKKYTQYYYNYYQGAMMALDQLDQDYDDMPEIKAFIIDSKSDKEGLNMWGRNKLKSMDMVFSAMTDDNETLAAQLKGTGVPLIATLSLSSIDNDYDHYIQVQPTLEVHCTNIAQEIAERYKYEANVICIHDESDVSKRAMEYGQMHNQSNTIKYDASFNINDIKPLLRKNKTNVFYITTLNSKNSKAVLDQLYTLTGNIIDIYGMPTWSNLNIPDYTNKGMNITFTTGFYKHSEDKGKPFAEAYKKRYGEDAPTIAYKSYESTYYFISKFLESDKNFYLELLNDQEPRPINDINIEEHCEDGKLKFWENTNVYFIDSKDGDIKLDGQ